MLKLYVQNGTLENLKKPSVQVFSENQTNYVKTRFESNKKISLFRNRNEGQTNITNITSPTPLQVKIFNKSTQTMNDEQQHISKQTHKINRGRGERNREKEKELVRGK